MRHQKEDLKPGEEGILNEMDDPTEVQIEGEVENTKVQVDLGIRIVGAVNLTGNTKEDQDQIIVLEV